MLKEAQEAFDIKDYEKTAALADQAISIEPEVIDAYDLLGSTYLRLGKEDPENYGKALEAYEKVISLDRTKELLTAFNIGECYFLMGEYDQAINYFQKFRTSPVAGQFSDIVELKLFLCHLMNGNSSYVEQALKGVTPSPNSSLYYYAHAAQEYKNGDPSKGKEYLDSAARIYPRKTHNTMADAFVELGWIAEEKLKAKDLLTSPETKEAQETVLTRENDAEEKKKELESLNLGGMEGLLGTEEEKEEE